MPSHNTANPAAATPTKLRNGSWGATTAATVEVGDVVRITTKAGKSWEALVASVVWTGDGKRIVSTQSLDGSERAGAYRYSGRTRRASGWTGCRCGSIEGRPRDSDCASCQHDY